MRKVKSSKHVCTDVMHVSRLNCHHKSAEIYSVENIGPLFTNCHLIILSCVALCAGHSTEWTGAVNGGAEGFFPLCPAAAVGPPGHWQYCLGLNWSAFLIFMNRFFLLIIRM